MGEEYPTTLCEGELQHMDNEVVRQSRTYAYLTEPKSAQSHSERRTLWVSSQQPTVTAV